MSSTHGLDRLKRLSIVKMRRHWVEQIGGRKPPKVKVLLARDLVWHAQESAHGGMDAQTRSLLKSAIKQATGESACAHPRPRKESKATSPRSRQKAELQTGAKLVRTWRGRTHEVTVMEDGKRYAYQNEVYSSLTQIAEKITGAHWSGPRFFGLHRVRGIQ